MEKLEKAMGTKWVLLVVSALIAALSIGQELHLSDWQMSVNIAALGIATSLCCGAFCELARKTIYGTSYNWVNVGVWIAVAVVECVIASLVW